MAIAGAFFRPRIRGTQQWQPEHGPTQKMPRQVSQAQVSELVANIEPNALGMPIHGINDIRHQHHVLKAEEFRREGIQRAIAVDYVGLRTGRQLQAFAAGLEMSVEIGKLRFRELDPITPPT